MNFERFRIVSDGQTGAGGAGLDWAIQHGIAHGGWCRKGRSSGNGTIPSQYQLQETPSSNGQQCIEWNVRDSHGTVIFSVGGKLFGGSLETFNIVQKMEKPWIYLSAARREDAPRLLWKFIEDNQIRVLNVAGPRASEEPEVGQFATAILDRLYTPALIYLVQGPSWVDTFKAEIEQEITPPCIVRAFSDPKKALRRFVLESCEPDLLITGFLFRGMSGVELLQECKRLKPRLKVMMFAATPQACIEAALGTSPVRPDAYVNIRADMDMDAFWAVTHKLLRFHWPKDCRRGRAVSRP
jgi:hypothetical protein